MERDYSPRRTERSRQAGPEASSELDFMHRNALFKPLFSAFV